MNSFLCFESFTSSSAVSQRKLSTFFSVNETRFYCFVVVIVVEDRVFSVFMKTLCFLRALVIRSDLNNLFFLKSIVSYNMAKL